jgi:hypothetical protein
MIRELSLDYGQPQVGPAASSPALNVLNGDQPSLNVLVGPSRDYLATEARLLSTTTVPSFMTQRTFLMATWMSASGLPVVDSRETAQQLQPILAILKAADPDPIRTLREVFEHAMMLARDSATDAVDCVISACREQWLQEGPLNSSDAFAV